MKQARTNYKPRQLKKSRIIRRCDFCNKPINKGELYAKTGRGFTYCKACA